MRGLWLLPRVQSYRHQGQQDGDNAKAQALDCSQCPKTFNHATRARWHCGLLPFAEMTGEGWEWECGAPWVPEMPQERYEPRTEWLSRTLCPGFLSSQDRVLEASRAVGWKASLPEFYDDQPTAILFDAIDLIEIARNEVEAEQMRKASQRGGK